MNRTTLIAAAATGAISLAALILQANRNRTLADQVESESAAVAQLERQAAAPDAAPGPVSALNPYAPLPGSIEAAVAKERANTTPQERIDRAVSRIELLVADISDLDRSPAELFRLLPDLLRLVQDLDLDEMIAVAEKIDAPLTMNANSGKSAMKMILMMLAAEQDPERILRIPAVGGDRPLRQTVLNALARRDPEAARRWMENSSMSESEKKDFERSLTFRLLREDFNAGLERLREGDGEMLQILAMAGQFAVNENTLPDVIAALDRPENAELRPSLVNMVINASIAEGGVAGARQRVGEMGLSKEEVESFLTGNPHAAMQQDPGGLLDWMSEVQSPETLAKSLPDAIQGWAHRDYNAAGEWLGKMPASAAKDSAMDQYSRTVAEIDPKAAAIWAMQIGDEELRNGALKNSLRQWRASDAPAAEAWIGANDIDITVLGSLRPPHPVPIPPGLDD